MANIYIDQDRSAIRAVRDSMLLHSAEGKFLTEVGGNYGVVRPPASPFDDELFRAVIPVMAWLPKTITHTAYALAAAIFGSQEDIVAAGGVAWQFYEVNANEIIFEIPNVLLEGNTNATASYLHGYPGFATAIAGPTNIVTVEGDDAAVAIASGNYAGVKMYLFYSGVWNEHTINSHSYAGSTNTFTMSASTVPTLASAPMFIDIPGTSSFRGDFMAEDASVAAGGVNPPSDDLVYLYGQGKLDIFSFYFDFVRAAGVVLRTEIM